MKNVDACLVNQEKPEAGRPPADRFVPPSRRMQTVSNKLVFERLLPQAHGVVVVQGEVACKTFARLPRERVVKVPASELSNLLTDEEIQLLLYPMGQSQNDNWGVYRLTSVLDQVSLAVLIPSLTNMVPRNTQPVSLDVRIRFSCALGVVVKLVRHLAGLAPVPTLVKEVAEVIRGCILKENESRVRRILWADQSPLRVTFISPNVQGGKYVCVHLNMY